MDTSRSFGKTEEGNVFIKCTAANSNSEKPPFVLLPGAQILPGSGYEGGFLEALVEEFKRDAYAMFPLATSGSCLGRSYSIDDLYQQLEQGIVVGRRNGAGKVHLIEHSLSTLCYLLGKLGAADKNAQRFSSLDDQILTETLIAPFTSFSDAFSELKLPWAKIFALTQYLPIPLPSYPLANKRWHRHRDGTGSSPGAGLWIHGNAGKDFLDIDTLEIADRCYENIRGSNKPLIVVTEGDLTFSPDNQRKYAQILEAHCTSAKTGHGFFTEPEAVEHVVEEAMRPFVYFAEQRDAA